MAGGGTRHKEGGSMKDRLKEKALFESSPVWQAVLKLAFPTVIGQIILVVYNIADTFFIGLTGSDAMVTCVTVCMPAFMFLSAISNLFGIGGASVISRALGSQDRDRAQNTAAFAFWGCLAVSLLYSLGTLLCLNPFIDMLGGSAPAVHPMARQYLLVTVVLGGVCTAMSTFLSHLVRSEGRSVHASFGITLGGLVNIALDPLFIFVLLPKGMEVLGAAIATALANVISLLYFAAILRSRNTRSVLNVRFSRLMFQNGIPADVIGCGLPACLMTLCENISYAVLDNLMALNGVSFQAGLGVAKKVNMLAHCIVRGMAQGVLPLISYNYASGNHRRMKEAVLLSTSVSVILAGACTAASLTVGRQLVNLFLQSASQSVDFGAQFLRILCIGGPFSACAYAIISFFQAVGCGMKSFVLAILRKGLLDIPLMFALRRVSPMFGIVWATPIADILCCVASVGLFVVFIYGKPHRAENKMLTLSQRGVLYHD